MPEHGGRLRRRRRKRQCSASVCTLATVIDAYPGSRTLRRVERPDRSSRTARTNVLTAAPSSAMVAGRVSGASARRWRLSRELPARRRLHAEITSLRASRAFTRCAPCRGQAQFPPPRAIRRASSDAAAPRRFQADGRRASQVSMSRLSSTSRMPSWRAMAAACSRARQGPGRGCPPLAQRDGLRRRGTAEQAHDHPSVPRALKLQDRVRRSSLMLTAHRGLGSAPAEGTARPRKAGSINRRGRRTGAVSRRVCCTARSGSAAAVFITLRAGAAGNSSS